MILDSLENFQNYLTLHPQLEKAYTYLQGKDLANAAPGRYDLDGDQLFALVSEGSGVAKTEAKLEVHRKYWDIQYIISGTDHMGWKPLASCGKTEKPYNEERDFALFADAAEVWFDVAPGQFTIFFPTDAHAPMTTLEVIKKVVIKVAV